MFRKVKKIKVEIAKKLYHFRLRSGSRRKLSTLPIYAEEEDSKIDMTGLAADDDDASDSSKINVSFRLISYRESEVKIDFLVSSVVKEN